MAEFHGFLPSLPAISIVNIGVGVVGWGVGWGVGGGEEGGKNHYLGHLISSHNAHTVANDTPMDYIVSGSKPRSPLPNWHPSWVPLF